MEGKQQPGRAILVLFLSICAFVIFGSFTLYSSQGLVFGGVNINNEQQAQITPLLTSTTGVGVIDAAGDEDNDNDNVNNNNWVPSWQQQRNRKLVYVDIARTDENHHHHQERIQNKMISTQAVVYYSSASDGGSMKEEDHLLTTTIEENNVNAFLLETGNPIRRTIYHLYHNSNGGGHEEATVDQQQQRQLFDECYPKSLNLQLVLDVIDEIFQRINNNKSEQQQQQQQQQILLTDCQKLLLRVLRGGSSDETFKTILNPYLYKNIGYYLDKVIDGRHPSFEIFVIRNEVLEEDLTSLRDEYFQDRTTATSSGSTTQLEKEKDEKEETPPLSLPVTPTKKQFQNLCCILWQELDKYQQILDRSINLSTQDKEGTIIDLIDTCSVLTTSSDTKDNESIIPPSQILRSGYGINWYKWYQFMCPDVSSFL